MVAAGIKFSEFVVEHNKPKAIKIITDEQDLPFNTFTEEIRKGNKRVKTTTRTINTDQEECEDYSFFFSA